MKGPLLAGLSHAQERNSPKSGLAGCRGRIRTATFPTAKTPLISQENFEFFRAFQDQRLLHPTDAESGVCTSVKTARRRGRHIRPHLFLGGRPAVWCSEFSRQKFLDLVRHHLVSGAWKYFVSAVLNGGRQHSMQMAVTIPANPLSAARYACSVRPQRWTYHQKLPSRLYALRCAPCSSPHSLAP